MMKRSALNKKIRLRFLASLVLAVFFQLDCMGNTTQSLAAPPKDIKFYRALFKGDQAIKEIQTNLDLIFPEIILLKDDGIIGTETTKALNEFRRHFEIKPEDDTRARWEAALKYYAKIARTEQTWEKDTQKQNFICWLERLLDRHDMKNESLKLLDSEAPQRLILLKFFKRENPYLSSCSECNTNGPANKKTTQPEKTDEWIASYKLTADIIEEWKAKNKIIEKLQDFKNKKYPDKNKLIKALETKFKDLMDQIRNYDNYLSSIVQQAQKITTYQLPPESIIKLKFENIPEPVLEQLRQLRVVPPYKTKKDLKNAIDIAVKIGIKEGPTDNNYQHSIYAYIQPTTSYELTEQLLKNIADQSIPAEIIDQIKNLEGLEGIEYSSKDLFFKALNVSVNSEKIQNILKWFLENEANLEAYKKIKIFFEELGTSEKDINKELSKLGAARNEHSFNDPKLNTKSDYWTGGSCGCLLDDLAGTVYGFYPFWLAQDEKDPASEPEEDESTEISQVQKINFSVLTRIGYYALPINDKGELIQNSKQITGQIKEFKKIAHKYRTKLDIVIYHSDWQAWCNPAQPIGSEATDKFTTNIVKMVESHADGVTMDLDGYPQDAASLGYLIELIKELRKKLKAANKNYFLNIMVPMHKLDPGICTFRGLESLVASDNNQEESDKHDDVDLILVPIAEPTKEIKKMLRQGVETTFSGELRRKFLRKTVPVITPRGNNEDQLKDDIIYFKDNFGGIGLWPLPTLTGNNGQGEGNNTESPVLADVVNTTISSEYQEENADPVFGICRILCPNRWVVRIIWDILGVFLILYAVLYIISCRLRHFSRSSKIYFWINLGVVILWILASLALLYCDPFNETTREGNWPLILIVLGGIVAAVFRQRNKTKQDNNP